MKRTDRTEKPDRQCGAQESESTQKGSRSHKRDRAVAVCIVLAVMGVALYMLVCLCRIAPPVSVLFYMTPDSKLSLIRSLVFPSLVCGILCILREAMDGTARLCRASVAAVTAFALLPVGCVALFQLTGQYGVSAQQCAAVGICLICFLLAVLTRELLPSAFLRKAHPVLRGVLSLVGAGLWSFCAFLGLTGRFLTLWAAASVLSLPSSLFGWVCFLLWKEKPWVRAGIAVCILAVPVYLAVLQPYDADARVSALVCGILLFGGMLFAVIAGIVSGIGSRRAAARCKIK